MANARVVEMVPGYWERRTTESINYDQEEPGAMNLGNASLLPNVWNRLTEYTLIATPTLMMMSPSECFSVPYLFNSFKVPRVYSIHKINLFYEFMGSACHAVYMQAWLLVLDSFFYLFLCS